MLTGESIAVFRKPGDVVVGSTLNKTGWIEYRVTGTGENTVLSQIVRMVRDAQRSKAPIQSLGDRISAVFVPIVVSIAVITFVAWLLIIGQIPRLQPRASQRNRSAGHFMPMCYGAGDTYCYRCRHG